MSALRAIRGTETPISPIINNHCIRSFSLIYRLDYLGIFEAITDMLAPMQRELLRLTVHTLLRRRNYPQPVFEPPKPCQACYMSRFKG
jgi:hypothetical protein